MWMLCHSIWILCTRVSLIWLMYVIASSCVAKFIYCELFNLFWVSFTSLLTNFGVDQSGSYVHPNNVDQRKYDNSAERVDLYYIIIKLCSLDYYNFNCATKTRSKNKLILAFYTCILPISVFNRNIQYI